MMSWHGVASHHLALHCVELHHAVKLHLHRAAWRVAIHHANMLAFDKSDLEILRKQLQPTFQLRKALPKTVHSKLQTRRSGIGSGVGDTSVVCCLLFGVPVPAGCVVAAAPSRGFQRTPRFAKRYASRRRRRGLPRRPPETDATGGCGHAVGTNKHTSVAMPRWSADHKIKQ